MWRTSNTGADFLQDPLVALRAFKDAYDGNPLFIDNLETATEKSLGTQS